MRIRTILLCLAALVAAASCSSRGGLEKLAMKRLPTALEKAMEVQMGVKGGAKIQSPEIIYDCDSICMIQFQALAKDSAGEDYTFPVRYIFVKDVFMSAAKGHPVYSEMVAGSPKMDREEVQKLKDHCREHGTELYVFYSGAASPIDSEDLW